MADVKISALPAATTPLDGTELVPIVQGGITEQVSVANLTTGRTVAASTVNVDANSASAAVRITQTGAGNSLVVEDSANPDSTPFVIDTNGTVIAGGTARFTTATTGGPIMQVAGSSTIARFVNDANANSLEFIKSRSTTFGDPSVIVNNGDVLGNVIFEGADGTAFVRAASISAAVDAAPGAGDIPGRLVFATTPDGGAVPAERMRIDSAGQVGIGGTPSAGMNLLIAKNATGAATAYGTRLQPTYQSDVTTLAIGYSTALGTAAAAFTIPNLQHYRADQGSFGATSVVTNQMGFVAGTTLTGATNNYGFYGNIAAASNRWNFFANGTANNAFAGNSRFGGVTAPVATVDVTGSVAATTTILSSGATSGVGYAAGAGGAVTQGTSRTTGVTLNNVSGAITLFSAAGSASYQSFTVTNSAVAATDTIIVNQKSGTDNYIILVTAVAAGSFQITFATTGGTTTEQPVFNFAVIKAVAA